MKGVPYAEAIGSMLWATVVSRPDTAFAVGILSQFIQNPGIPHWEGVKRLILPQNHKRVLAYFQRKETHPARRIFRF